MEVPPTTGLVTLTSDFGLRDPYVGIMKGVIKQRFTRAEMVDVCHDVPPQDVVVGALFLRSIIARFPVGTVHVAVVDPGVGTERRALAVCAAGSYWIGPDNGLLSPLLVRPDAEARAIDTAALRLKLLSRTFHGRDVFAPVGGLLAGRRYGFRALGPRVSDPVVLEPAEALSPRVLLIDHFGNLITSVHADEARAQVVEEVGIAGHRVPLLRTYGEAQPGDLLALINSYELLEVAVSGGSAAEVLGVGRDEPITLLPGKEEGP